MKLCCDEGTQKEDVTFNLVEIMSNNTFLLSVYNTNILKANKLIKLLLPIRY